MAVIRKYKRGGFWQKEKVNAGKLAIKHITESFDKLGVPYFLHCGTLLGCVREKRFISIDVDVDFAICAENYTPKLEMELRRYPPLFVQGVKKFCASERNKLFYGPEDEEFWPYKVGVKVQDPETKAVVGCDIGIFYLGKGEREGRRCHYRTSMTFPRENMEKLRVAEFYGMRVTIPENAEGHLELQYGKNWSIPLEVSAPGNYYTDEYMRESERRKQK